ncbi:hypothetical protein [Nitrososphaera sp.]|uniref:hypothetical protein n=1 Tax=Nitrososphaera sp. TaxID=1971748 RepID=UPI00307D61B7
MFSVKKMGKNGQWGTVSLIDEKGSFRGEAIFDTKEQAEKYAQEYKKRMKKPVDVKVVDESKETKVAKPGSSSGRGR